MQSYGYNEFTKYLQNWTAAQGSGGTSVAIGGSNTMGSWVDLFGATLDEDGYGIHIKVQNSHTSGSNRPILIDIGMDTAGGTSYTVLIPYLGVAGPLDGGGTSWRSAMYYLPVFMPEGSRIAARAQTSYGTPGTTQIRARIAMGPTNPQFVRCGTYVDAIGADALNSVGTEYTPGNNTDGSWTSLGTASREAWFATMGLINASSSATNNFFVTDLAVGDATAKQLLMERLQCGHSSQIATVWNQYPEQAQHCVIHDGDELFVRGNEPGTPDSNYTAIAYLVGGQ